MDRLVHNSTVVKTLAASTVQLHSLLSSELREIVLLLSLSINFCVLTWAAALWVRSQGGDERRKRTTTAIPQKLEVTKKSSPSRDAA